MKLSFINFLRVYDSYMYDKFDVIYQKSTKNLLRLIEFHFFALQNKKSLSHVFPS